MRIIPTLLVRGHHLVKGRRFGGDRIVGVGFQAAMLYAKREPDELLILDIGATERGKGPNLELVQQLSENLFIPLTVGGGIRSLADVRELLRAGADKVAIGTAARGPGGVQFVRELSAHFGSQAIVVSVDLPHDGAFHARQCAAAGAGEILLQNRNRDGTLQGYDLAAINEVASAVPVPVIASGGCSGYEDMAAALRVGASAVAAGALFQFRECTPRGAAHYLESKGFVTREIMK